MNEARDKMTGEIVLAEELRLIKVLDKYNYECPDPTCKSPQTASSFLESHKKRPYFTVSDQSKQHVEGCKYTELENFYKRARSGKVNTNEFIKANYPSKLVIPEKKVKSPDDTENENQEVKSGNHTPSQLQGDSGQKRSNQVVTALGRIVEFYLNCPSLRHLPLELPELHVGYKFAFKQIFGTNSGNQYKGGRIYIGNLQVAKDAVIENERELIIKLHDFGLIDNAETQKKERVFYQLLVPKANLSKRKITMVKNEITYTRRESAKAYQKFKDDPSSEKDMRQPYIFFLADPPNEETPYQFEAIEGMVVARLDQILQTINPVE